MLLKYDLDIKFKSQLVPGDIIEIKGGDRIPADIRIIFSQEMKVDNSSLTGESEPLLRTTECTHKENPLETGNLAFFGTLCKEGRGRGIVINIGDHTVIGTIANLAITAETTETPLHREMNRFVKMVAIIAVTTGVVLFILGFLLGYPTVTNLIFGIGVLAAYVPEGLVTCVVISLALTAKILAKKKVLVKTMESVETLGSTTCICSDKTGTLTQNRMTVQHLYYDGNIMLGENLQKKGPNGKVDYDVGGNTFKLLQHCAILSSEAVYDEGLPQGKLDQIAKIKDEQEVAKKRQELEEDYKKELETILWLDRPTIGDASETALIKFFQPIKDIVKMREDYPIKKMDDASLAKIPFNSIWKYALTICYFPTRTSIYTIFIKVSTEIF